MKVGFRGPGLAPVTPQSVLGGQLSLLPSLPFSRNALSLLPPLSFSRTVGSFGQICLPLQTPR